MEKLLFKSADNFEIAIGSNSEQTKISKKDVYDVLSPIEDTEVNNTTTSSNRIMVITDGVDNDYSYASTGITNMSWTITILLSFVVWIMCTVSLILNIVRKNVGKAIFSGVGLILPLIAIFIASMGKSIQEINEGENSIGLIITIFALIVQIVVEIVAFIFCFSKNKNKDVQTN